MKKTLGIIIISCAALVFIAPRLARAEVGPMIDRAAIDVHARHDMTIRQVSPTQDMLDDTPHQQAPEGVVIPVDTSKAVLDDCTSGRITDCYYYDEINTQLKDMDCDCIPEINRHGIHVDNCAPDGVRPAEMFYNPDQIDSDGDGKGDVCTDSDGDSIMDDEDNCIDVPNADQADEDGDADGDGIGDACEDGDNDGLQDEADNCPRVANASQNDVDDDDVGDTCDNCPIVENTSQLDTDMDGRGDACSNDDDGDGVTDAADNCPVRYNPDQDDFDGDNVGDPCDNCMDVYNPGQEDIDSNGLGDVCESPDLGIGLPGPFAHSDGGCTMIPTNAGANALTGLILLAFALIPTVIRRRKK